ncbi:MAG TPA: DUF3343 domain-containing protein [Firmicutes bacterium]|nr:DUF3343 domain-containing protein [Bacillota bacterium]
MMCVVFSTVHEAMKLDLLLAEAGIKHSVVPTPRWLSRSCGVAIALADGEAELAVREAEKHGVAIKGIFPLHAPEAESERVGR